MSDPVQFTGMRVLGDDAKTGIDNAAYINNEQNAENETKLDSPTSHKHEQKFEKDPPETKYEIPSEYDNIPDVNFGDKTTADSRAGEAEDEHYNAYNRAIVGSRETIYSFYEDHTKVIHTGFGLFLLVLYFAYVAYAFYYRFGDEGSWRLLGVTIFIVLIITITKLSEAYEESINAWWDRVKEYQKSKYQPANLISVAGMVLYIIIFYIFSINPAKVNWHTVFWGIALQYVFALLILRTETGYQIFKWLGDRVVGRFLAFCMGTTPAESINAAANIFVSMTESPLMIRPFLEDMTRSELHAAASNGATASLKIIGAILVNVIAFLSLLAFLNATLTWIGHRVKTFTNEFIAYGNLKVLIENRQALSNYTTFHNTTDWFWDKGNVVLNITGEVLAGGFISEKSEIISTYALCGFANFGSIGITLGGLGSLAPSRRSDLTQMVVRAMICGNVACFLTACIAGLLYKPF
ncbi:S28A3-like protein [Mya arenaria]|uniref:S28A3-like protein n=1 Tax=Mya arenaria TaxID=6604 RepID=A0ABY7DD37_MYAAR|nr:S28A3-like protein [Mya arenaria]